MNYTPELIIIPAADKMPTSEMFDQRLRSCKAYEGCWHEGASYAGRWRTVLDIPRRRRIYRSNGKFCLLEGLDHCWKGISNFTRETEAYNNWSA